MRIACPSCAATYEVPDSRLRPGKLVRCAQCGSEWLPVRAPDEIAASPEQDEAPASAGEFEVTAPVPGFTAMDRLAAAPVPPPSHSRLIGAWVLTFVVLACAVAATVGWRDAVIRAWPPSARVLAAEGQTRQHAQTAGKKAE
jgi:predicted Zn finger-like uncharacterized protein